MAKLIALCVLILALHVLVLALLVVQVWLSCICISCTMYNEAWQRWWPDADAAVCCYRTALLTVPFHDKYFGSLILMCFTCKSTHALHRLYHAPFPSLISLSASKYIYHKCLLQISILEYLHQGIIFHKQDYVKLTIESFFIQMVFHPICTFSRVTCYPLQECKEILNISLLHFPNCFRWKISSSWKNIECVAWKIHGI